MLKPADIINPAINEVLRAEAGRESFAGFAVVGQPFASGDVLCLRRFRTSTIGPGYQLSGNCSPAGEGWSTRRSRLAVVPTLHRGGDLRAARRPEFE